MRIDNQIKTDLLKEFTKELKQMTTDNLINKWNTEHNRHTTQDARYRKLFRVTTQMIYEIICRLEQNLDKRFKLNDYFTDKLWNYSNDIIDDKKLIFK